jgi:hypothetical protein
MKSAPRLTIQPMTSINRQLVDGPLKDVASAITIVLFIAAAIALAINIQGGTI